MKWGVWKEWREGTCQSQDYKLVPATGNSSATGGKVKPGNRCTAAIIPLRVWRSVLMVMNFRVIKNEHLYFYINEQTVTDSTPLGKKKHVQLVCFYQLWPHFIPLTPPPFHSHQAPPLKKTKQRKPSELRERCTGCTIPWQGLAAYSWRKRLDIISI